MNLPQERPSYVVRASLASAVPRVEGIQGEQGRGVAAIKSYRRPKMIACRWEPSQLFLPSLSAIYIRLLMIIPPWHLPYPRRPFS